MWLCEVHYSSHTKKKCIKVQERISKQTLKDCAYSLEKEGAKNVYTKLTEIEAKLYELKRYSEKLDKFDTLDLTLFIQKIKSNQELMSTVLHEIIIVWLKQEKKKKTEVDD